MNIIDLRDTLDSMDESSIREEGWSMLAQLDPDGSKRAFMESLPEEEQAKHLRYFAGMSLFLGVVEAERVGLN